MRGAIVGGGEGMSEVLNFTRVHVCVIGWFSSSQSLSNVVISQ